MLRRYEIRTAVRTLYANNRITRNYNDAVDGGLTLDRPKGRTARELANSRRQKFDVDLDRDLDFQSPVSYGHDPAH